MNSELAYSKDACRGLYGACSITFVFFLGVLSTRVNPDTLWIRVDGQIRFEYATCGWKYF